jgi:hypothetical protein
MFSNGTKSTIGSHNTSVSVSEQDNLHLIARALYFRDDNLSRTPTRGGGEVGGSLAADTSADV